MPLYKVVITVTHERAAKTEIRMFSAPNRNKTLARVAEEHITVERIDGLEAIRLIERGIKLEEIT